jgi:hypothetical protein
MLLGAVPLAAQGSSSPATAATDTAVASAEKAANAWLGIVDGAQYGPSWDNAGTAFQQGVTKDQWIKTIQKVRGQVGPLGSRTLQHAQYTTSIPNMPAGEYAMIQYKTESGSGGFVTETVAMQREGARGWRVVGYFVKPA